jgi:hypothetical protein
MHINHNHLLLIKVKLNTDNLLDISKDKTHKYLNSNNLEL